MVGVTCAVSPPSLGRQKRDISPIVFDKKGRFVDKLMAVNVCAHVCTCVHVFKGHALKPCTHQWLWAGVIASLRL